MEQHSLRLFGNSGSRNQAQQIEQDQIIQQRQGQERR
jgi:hypothetical protein